VSPFDRITVIILNDHVGRNIDYSSGPYILTYPARQTSYQFVIRITDDNVLENFETFNLTIDSLSLPNNITTSVPSETVVLIVDDDGKEWE